MEVVRSLLSKGVSEKTQTDVSLGSPSELPLQRGRPVGENEFFTERELQSAVEQANAVSVMFDRSLKFEYRREADIYQVSVIDTAKDEVVRKIPPDEIVRFIESIKEMFGALLDVQA